MRRIISAVAFSFLVNLSAANLFAGEVPVNLDAEKLTEIPNAVLLSDKLAAGGTPTAKGLGQAAEQGIRTVIDVRDPKEGTAQEKDFAEAVGLKYVNIPVTLDGFSPAQAEQLNAVLKDPATGPALLHCATGQRALAIWALQRNHSDGVPAQQVIDEAEAKGLKKPELIEKLRSLTK